MRQFNRYFSELMHYLPENEQLQLQHTTGANEKQISTLLEVFPQCPQALISLLNDVNGTYYCKHGEHTICVLVLGSDLYEYPYYLKSIEQIMNDYQVDNQDSILDRYSEFIDQIEVDERINIHVPLRERLCFSDCMNNGGTSSLYIDFTPNEGGKVGQIIRYVHDPDSYEVIAPSFDVYLQQLMDGAYEFTAFYEDEL
ncbi:SMI1/KNR4 family protein [Lysinibacillus parviboronicapiens]|uniref:SMI1/KNR4 family protein n=1 Tax=Lysinibacillus parviboronicapiens TaxID=436516 RepID=UPI0006D07F8F|nr:SMI1/KNR4 family protein [Lysinibacillus parviboronicapiens]